jgi:membrane-bound acyltransferase YfiQ involved in biofilm formation
MYKFIKVMRRIFDTTAVRVILILLVGIPGLGFLVWTLLIEGTGFRAFFSTASADERAALRLTAIAYWVLVVGWLGTFLRLLCSSSYLDMLPVLRSFVLLLLGVFAVAWVLLVTSMGATSLVNFIPVVPALLFFVGTLPLPRQRSP